MENRKIGMTLYVQQFSLYGRTTRKSIGFYSFKSR